MKVYILIGVTDEKSNDAYIAHCLLASYTRKSCEKKMKEINNSHLKSYYKQLIIEEQPIKRTNDMITKEMDDRIKFHNGMVRRGR